MSARRDHVTHRAPPQGVGVRRKVLVELVLHQVDEEGGEDQNQEADVPGRHQFLQAEVKQDDHRGDSEFS